MHCKVTCILYKKHTVYNRVRQRLFGFTSGWLGWTSGHERWAHFLKILLSRNELITQALHLSFSIITNGMKKSWKMVVLVIIFTDFCVVFLDFVLLFDIFHPVMLQTIITNHNAYFVLGN